MSQCGRFNRIGIWREEVEDIVEGLNEPLKDGV